MGTVGDALKYFRFFLFSFSVKIKKIIKWFCFELLFIFKPPYIKKMGKDGIFVLFIFFIVLILKHIEL